MRPSALANAQTSNSLPYLHALNYDVDEDPGKNLDLYSPVRYVSIGV